MQTRRTLVRWVSLSLLVGMLNTQAHGQESARAQAEVWVDKGLSLGDNSDAEAACYRRAAEVDPTYAAAYFNLGYVLQFQKKYDEALAAYKLCLRFDPDRLDALLNAGSLALHAERDLEEGRRFLNRYIESAERTPDADKEQLVALTRTVGELEEQIAKQKACSFADFYTAEEVVEILTRRITRQRGGGSLYSAGRVPIRLFEPGSAVLSPEAQHQLDEIGSALYDPRLSGIDIIVEGHADATGDSKANLELSSRRASAVATFLTDRWQVPWEVITVRWYGEDCPVAANQTPEGRRNNRRIEINNAIACW